MNTTFYLTDNPPQKGRLRFLSDFFSKSIPPDVRPHAHYTDDRKNPFQVWCADQLYVDLHPMAGGAVIFYSHIPHQGAKKLGATIRINLVRILFYITSKTRCFQAYDSLAIHKLLWIS